MRKRWAARPAPDLNLKEADNPFDLPESISLLLARRGYCGEKLNRYLHPDMDALTHPKSVGGVLQAAQRISSAVRNEEKILIHGDFDADGITATVMLYLGLKSLGASVNYFIPDRFEDGYGVSESGIKACSEVNASLIITVDCGITAVDSVRILKDLDIDTVITDHHQPGDSLPEAEAIVNPVLDAEGPHSKMAGVGVAWMVARAVFELLDADMEYLHELLQFVAVGTVTDVVELAGDNRILVFEGLKQLRENPLPGIAALVRSASLNVRDISSTDLAFYLGPRLNACGRVGHAADAVELLLAGSSEEAGKRVKTVEKHNRARRKLDREIETEVCRLADNLDNPRCIVMSDEGWHRGVIGIVASRLVSRYGVPSVMISIDNGFGYGSARSVPGIPIFSILKELQADRRIMDSLGGHPMAAGFRIPEDNIPLLRDELNSILAGDEWTAHLGSVLYIDGKLEEQDYNADFIRYLEMLEPFGEGNRKPVWLARGAYPQRWRAVGKNMDHLSCDFRIGSSIYNAIGFSMLNRQSMFNDRVDLAFTLSLNTYRGDNSVQLVLKDIRRHRRVFN
ncbi:MAG: single-stranded-DNA-specific exonuclease RecJ [Candidatus Fermentibacteria bacterium]